MNWRVVFLLLCAGFMASIPVPVFAFGPAMTELTAKADTAVTVYLNPAGMSRIIEPAWYVNPMVMYTKSSTEYSVNGGAKRTVNDDDNITFLPALYYAHPLNDRWVVGIGPNAITGLGFNFDANWPGRYLITEWSQIFIGVVPSISYRVNNKFSIGFSLSLNYALFTLEKAVFDPGEPDGNFELEADGYGIGGNLGLLYEFTPLTRIGLVYRSEVEAENEGKPELSGLSENTLNPLVNAGVLNKKISMDTNSPQSILAGIFHDFDNGWTMSLDGLWFDFSEWSVENISIGSTTITKGSTDYQDIWGISIGTTYNLSSIWTLRGGFLYLSAGIEDEDRTVMSRYDEMWAVGGGVQYGFSSGQKLALDLTYFQFGDGEFEVENIPIVGGSIYGKYETNYGILLGVTISW